MAKSIAFLTSVTFVALLVTVGPARAQQATAPPAHDPAEAQASPQPLDLQEALAQDVLEPLQAGMESRNLKQVLSVFNLQSGLNFSQLRDHMKALLDAYSAVRFRYKILQSSSESTNASVTCEVDLEGTPLDDGQVPMRRSTQMRLQLTHTPKGWRISAFSPIDFFNQ